MRGPSELNNFFCLCEPPKLYGAQVAERRVQPVRVVEQFNVAEDHCCGFGPGGEAPVVDRFRLQRREEAPRMDRYRSICVVVALATPAHARDSTILPEQTHVRLTRVLLATV